MAEAAVATAAGGDTVAAPTAADSAVTTVVTLRAATMALNGKAPCMVAGSALKEWAENHPAWVRNQAVMTSAEFLLCPAPILLPDGTRSEDLGMLRAQPQPTQARLKLAPRLPTVSGTLLGAPTQPVTLS